MEEIKAGFQRRLASVLVAFIVILF